MVKVISVHVRKRTKCKGQYTRKLRVKLRVMARRKRLKSDSEDSEEENDKLKSVAVTSFDVCRSYYSPSSNHELRMSSIISGRGL